MANGKNEDIIKKMASLLLQGATMLDLSCPQCGNLLYRLKNNKVYCPSCEREVIIKKKSSVVVDKKVNNRLFPSKYLEHNVFSEELFSIRKVISKICKKIEDIEQLDLLEIHIHVLDKLLNLYNTFFSLK
ncbi:MAG: Sjogren's syndrome/scleroderma autoantigen 1 family protein [Promethearchaeota archaeon]